MISWLVTVKLYLKLQCSLLCMQGVTSKLACNVVAGAKVDYVDGVGLAVASVYGNTLTYLQAMLKNQLSEFKKHGMEVRTQTPALQTCCHCARVTYKGTFHATYSACLASPHCDVPI